MEIEGESEGEIVIGNLRIARRGLGFNEKIPQSAIDVNAGLFRGDNIPEVNRTDWSGWGKVSRSRKSCGKYARHKFFGLTHLMGANCPDEEEHSPIELVVEKTLRYRN